MINEWNDRSFSWNVFGVNLMKTLSNNPLIHISVLDEHIQEKYFPAEFTSYLDQNITLERI